MEASAFYDMISGHGVGVLALPLETSLEMQQTFQNVAHRVAAMNGAARGVRVMYNRRFNDYVTASAGYSFVAAEADLFEPQARQRLRELSVAVDKVREKYGFSAMTSGSVLRAKRGRKRSRIKVADPCLRTADPMSRPDSSPAVPRRGTWPALQPYHAPLPCCSDRAGCTR